MALSEDQKAMLRLLAQREQGYDDLAALMGLSVEEVRSRVKEALEQLEAEGEEAPAVPPPEPPQPEPAEPAPAEPKSPPSAATAQPAEPKSPPAAAEPKSPPASPAAAERPPEAPGAEPAASEEEPPAPAAEPAGAAARPGQAGAAAKAGPAGSATGAAARPGQAGAATGAAGASAPGRTAAGRPKLGLPKDRGARAAIGAGLLALVAVVVLLIVGGGSDGDGGTASGSQSGSNATAANEDSLTQATLSPVDGGEGEGRAIFGRVKKNVVLQVEATGLEPSPKGSSYTIWLYKSPKLALRVGAVRVNKSGGIAVQLPIPSELLAYVASGAFDQVDIALTPNAAYAAEVARSKKAKQLPAHVGESVLRGKIEGPAIR